MESDEDMEFEDDWKCDFCHKPQHTLYEGWFYTSEKLNPWAQGTPSAGLMQMRRGCKFCVNQAIELGLSKADKIK